MAKISALPHAGPISGEEIIPIVQNGMSVGLSVAQHLAAFEAHADNVLAAAIGLVNYRATRAAGVADFPVGEFFSSAETGELRLYKRIAGAPFYEDQGDGVAPVTRVPLRGEGGSNMVGLKGGFTLEEFLDRACYPDLFGVVDDPNYANPALRINQAAALQAWATYAATNRLTMNCQRPIRAYSSATITLPRTVKGILPAQRLGNLDLITAVTPGFVIGGVTGTIDNAILELPSVRRATPSWTGNYATTQLGGVVLINVRDCSIYPGTIRHYPVGLQFWSEGDNILYNEIYGGRFIDNRHHVAGVCVGADSCFNQNAFFGGKYSYSSSTGGGGGPVSALNTGIILGASAGGYTGHNNNNWYSPSFEMPTALHHPNVAEGIPFFCDGVGGYNAVHDARAEGWRGPLMRVRGTVNGDANSFQGLYNSMSFLVVGGVGGVNGYVGVHQYGGAYGNTITLPARTRDVVWHSGPLRHTLYSGGPANGGRIQAPFFFREGTDPGNLRQGSGPYPNRSVTNVIGAQWNNGGHFIMLDVSKVKNFEFFADTHKNFPGRWWFQALDATFTPMGATSTDAYGTERNINFPGATSTSLYGGGWDTGGDFSRPSMVRVHDNVKYLVVAKTSGTKALLLTGFGFRAQQQVEDAALLSIEGGALLIDPFFDDERERKASANPATAGTHGLYGRGDVIRKSDAAVGQPTGYQCHLGGALAVARVNATAYPVPGEVLLAGANAYFVRVPGTTGAVAPSGTVLGVDEADGSVIWRFLGPKAAFTAMAVL